MAIFKALTAIGIGRFELADVSNESLIRIEKQLIAEQKLNNSISKNDVQNALRVLKDYADVLKEISHYDCFYGILTGYDAEYIDTIIRYPPQQADRIKLVVSNYFADELTDYINLNLSQNNWNNIRVLLHYRIFFDNGIIKTLTIRLESKMEYAIATIQQGGSHPELIKKINYLRDKEFYSTLGEVDKKHFLMLIVKLIDLIKLNPDYSSESTFFPAVKQAMRWYDNTNRALAIRLGFQVSQQTLESIRSRGKVSAARAFYFIVIFGVALFNLARSCNHTTSYSIPYNAPKSPWSGNYSSESTGYLDSVRQDQRSKMEDFVEARLNPVKNPRNILYSDNTKLKKYGNPFNLDIFSGSYNYVLNRVPRIAIINNTNKECVVIAYFRQRFDVGVKSYMPIDNINSIDIYAFYIPSHDSINVDMKMDLLRFYMGQKLAAFKTYRQHTYPDSLDAKFTKYTRADSMLFSKAFIPGLKNNRTHKKSAWKKVSVLTISQPSPDSYLLDWKGEAPLFQAMNRVTDIMNKHPDSIDRKKPLLLELNNQPSANIESKINSFIYN